MFLVRLFRAFVKEVGFFGTFFISAMELNITELCIRSEYDLAQNKLHGFFVLS